jgi:MoaA/NifB/PqqE/SkfB family radical SAM enzyme
METQPGPWRITFDTNPDDCNLSCIMCVDHSPYSTTRQDRIVSGKPKRRMDIDLIRRILNESQGTTLREIIPSTMGEPLIYKHFEEIIELCERYNIKLNLTTNGTFPRKDVDAWVRLILPVTSDVKISWNGAKKETQEKIMLGTQWEKVLNNVKRLIAIRNERFQLLNDHYCQVTLQLTFLESNVHELADIVQLGVELGVDRIKGHHLWAHFDEIKSLSMRRNKESIRRWNQAVIQAQAIANTKPLANGKAIKLENIYLLEDDADQDLIPGGECPFLGKEAWIAADGRFNPCCAPDKERRKLGDFGSLTNKTLEEIWNSPAYQALCKNYMQHEVCKGCNMRKAVIAKTNKVQKRLNLNLEVL